MFSSNKNSEFEMKQEISKEINLDKLTLWLIRLACIFIIIFFSTILLGVPILLSLIKTQYINFSLGIKDLIKSFIEIYLT
tara:strand:- start:148 stop:387 length:240 start_codon:yes stop_codon:yes gene_type:complete